MHPGSGLGCFSVIFGGRRGRGLNAHDERAPRRSSDEKVIAHDAPPCYTASSSLLSTDDKALPVLEGTIDALSASLRELSLQIWDAREIAWTEHKTHDYLVAFMKRQKGWTVTPHAYGLETAWEAVFEHGKGGRTMGFQCEEDALPGVGHACA